MTTIKLNRKEIEKELGTLDSKLQDKIIIAGVEIDSITSDEVTLDITPNRPDLLSKQGFVRFMKNYLGKSKIKEYSTKKPGKDYRVIIEKAVKDVRPFTVCAIVKNLKLNDERIKELVDIQEKLHLTIGRKRKKLAIGIYPLEKISLPIRFTALKPEEIKFVPLDSSEELNGRQILQKNATGREYAHLLEGKILFPVFIDSNKKILSMPPIINSNETGKITPKTKEVFVECSGFNQYYLNKALNILSSVFADMGGEIYQMQIEDKTKFNTPNLSMEKMPFNITDINKTLGLKLSEKEIKILLEKMGIGYEKNTALVPAYRTDIIHNIDLAEEVAIAYGYDKLIPEIPKVSTIGEESAESKFESKLAEILVGLGLIEISSVHLIKEDEAIKENIPEDKRIYVSDSKTDFKILRPSLIIPALRVFSENKDNEYPQNIFEIGTVFEKNTSSETGMKEEKRLIIAFSPANFTKIKQTIDYLMKMLSIKYEIKEEIKQGLIDGRTGIISIENNQIGYLGELSPEILQKWNIKMPIALAEISLSKLEEDLK